MSKDVNLTDLIRARNCLSNGLCQCQKRTDRHTQQVQFEDRRKQPFLMQLVIEVEWREAYYNKRKKHWQSEYKNPKYSEPDNYHCDFYKSFPFQWIDHYLPTLLQRQKKSNLRLSHFIKQQDELKIYRVQKNEAESKEEIIDLQIDFENEKKLKQRAKSVPNRKTEVQVVKKDELAQFYCQKHKHHSRTKSLEFQFCGSAFDGFSFYQMREAWQRLKQTGLIDQQLVEPILNQIKLQPASETLSVIVIENMQLEKIFQYLHYCENLLAVFVKGNQIITRDLPYMCRLKNLVKLDLSNNNIHFLPNNLSNLKKLQFLLLDHNKLVGISQLNLIAQIESLRLLTIHNNPCAKHPNSRKYLISNMIKLWALDSTMIMDFERNSTVEYSTKALTSSRFKPQAYEFKSQGWSQLQNLTTKERQRMLIYEYFDLRKAFERTSPVLTIQKWWRMLQKRWVYRNKTQAVRFLYWQFNKMHKRLKFEKMLSHQKKRKKWEIMDAYHSIFCQAMKSKKTEELSISCIECRSLKDFTLSGTNYWEDRCLYKGREEYYYIELKKQTILYNKWMAFFRLEQRKAMRFRLWKDIFSIYVLKKRCAKQILNLFQMRLSQKNEFPAFQCYSHPSYNRGLVICENDAKRLYLKYKELDGLVLVDRDRKNYKYPGSPFLSNIGQTMRFVGYIPTRKKQGMISSRPIYEINSKIGRFNRVFSNKRKDREPLEKLERLVLLESVNEYEFKQRFKQLFRRDRRRPLYIYPIKLIIKIKAAIRIQAWYKGIMTRQRQKRIFLKPGQLMRNLNWKNVSLNNTRYSDFAQVYRAVTKLKQFTSWYKVKQRINALAAICKHVRNIDQPQLQLDQNVYNNLQKIIDMNTRQPGCLLEAKNIRFKLENGKIAIKIDHERYVDTILPDWFCKKIGFQPQVMDSYRGKKMKSSFINELIHNPANRDCDVATFSLLTGINAFKYSSNSQAPYVRVYTGTVNEARTLAALIAILTSRYQRNSNFFVKVMSMQQLLSCNLNIRELTEFYNLPLVPEENLNENASVFAGFQQPHGGIIIKKKEPYMSIMRSRHRTNGRVQENIIILLGSKVEKIDKAIKNARLQNNFIMTQNMPNIFLTVENQRDHNLSRLSQQDIEVKLALLKSYIAETTNDVSKAYSKMKQKQQQKKDKEKNKLRQEKEMDRANRNRKNLADDTEPVTKRKMSSVLEQIQSERETQPKKSILKKSTKFEELKQDKGVKRVKSERDLALISPQQKQKGQKEKKNNAKSERTSKSRDQQSERPSRSTLVHTNYRSEKTKDQNHKQGREGKFDESPERASKKSPTHSKKKVTRFVQQESPFSASAQEKRQSIKELSATKKSQEKTKQLKASKSLPGLKSSLKQKETNSRKDMQKLQSSGSNNQIQEKLTIEELAKQKKKFQARVYRKESKQLQDELVRDQGENVRDELKKLQVDTLVPVTKEQKVIARKLGVNLDNNTGNSSRRHSAIISSRKEAVMTLGADNQPRLQLTETLSIPSIRNQNKTPNIEYSDKAALRETINYKTDDFSRSASESGQNSSKITKRADESVKVKQKILLKVPSKSGLQTPDTIREESVEENAQVLSFSNLNKKIVKAKIQVQSVITTADLDDPEEMMRQFVKMKLAQEQQEKQRLSEAIKAKEKEDLIAEAASQPKEKRQVQIKEFTEKVKFDSIIKEKNLLNFVKPMGLQQGILNPQASSLKQENKGQKRAKPPMMPVPSLTNLPIPKNRPSADLFQKDSKRSLNSQPESTSTLDQLRAVQKKIGYNPKKHKPQEPSGTQNLHIPFLGIEQKKKLQELERLRQYNQSPIKDASFQHNSSYLNRTQEKSKGSSNTRIGNKVIQNLKWEHSFQTQGDKLKDETKLWQIQSGRKGGMMQSRFGNSENSKINVSHSGSSVSSISVGSNQLEKAINKNIKEDLYRSNLKTGKGLLIGSKMKSNKNLVDPLKIPLHKPVDIHQTVENDLPLIVGINVNKEVAQQEKPKRKNSTLLFVPVQNTQRVQSKTKFERESSLRDLKKHIGRSESSESISEEKSKKSNQSWFKRLSKRNDSKPQSGSKLSARDKMRPLDFQGCINKQSFEDIFVIPKGKKDRLYLFNSSEDELSSSSDKRRRKQKASMLEKTVNIDVEQI